jgi:hypothetical protein
MCRGTYVKIALAATLAMSLVVTLQAGAADGHGKLVVAESFSPHEGVPIEGYYSYVRVVRSGRVVRETRLRGRHTTISLAPGAYQVVRYARICDGTCARLSDPGTKCRTDALVRRGARTGVQVFATAQRCRMRVSGPAG